MTHEQPSWERVLDLAVYAPIGVAVTLRDDLPKLARQGRQAVENRVVLARFIGRIAVTQGRRELEKRIEARNRAMLEGPDPSPVVVVPVAHDVPTVEPVEPVEPVTPVTEGTSIRASRPGRRRAAAQAPAATDLPIAEYESLAASQVVQRLGSLRADELVAIESFELAHRSRRTILGKISQLRGD